MRSLLRTAILTFALFIPPSAARAQVLIPPPSAGQCQEWVDALATGGQAALDVVTYSALSRCPDIATPALARAVLEARAVSDTAYLGRLASQAGEVRDEEVFAAALEVAADRRASDRARVMGLLVITRLLGASQEITGWTRPELFTRPVPRETICGFAIAGTSPDLDRGLPADAERRAARVIDGIVYGRGEQELVRNLARCARSVIDPDIPPQVDTTKIRLDHVCGRTFRVQNHTGATLTLSYVLIGTDARVVEQADVITPAIGGWTSFAAAAEGTLRLAYDGRELDTAASGRACNG